MPETCCESDEMSAVPKAKLSVADYLAKERLAPFKSEYYRGEMFAMAGASRSHNVIHANLTLEVGTQLKGSRCRTLHNDQRVLIDQTGLFCYPDLIIVCGEPQYAEVDPDSLTNPQVIFEVLSDSTELYDRTTKFRNYQKLPSLQEYVLISQHEHAAETFVKLQDGSWALRAFIGLDTLMELKTVNVKVPLRDIYVGVTLPEAGISE